MKAFIYKQKGREIEDSIDPVISHEQTSTHHIVNNGYHKYEIPKDEVEYWNITTTPEKGVTVGELYEKITELSEAEAEFNRLTHLVDMGQKVNQLSLRLQMEYVEKLRAEIVLK